MVTAIDYHLPAPTEAQRRWERDMVLPFVSHPPRRTLFGSSAHHVADVFSEEMLRRGMNARSLSAAAGIPEHDAVSIVDRGIAPPSSMFKAADILGIRITAFPSEMYEYL